ncbi:MAG: hypothetical protein ACRD0W_04360 [Acidimicrobiales bacterium]
MTVNREQLRVEATDTEASVTPLELFFDPGPRARADARVNAQVTA